MQHEHTLYKVKHQLQGHFGKALEQLLVFGSVARNSATNASDIDILIVLNDEVMPLDWQLEKTLIDLLYPIELEDDVAFDMKMMGKHDLYERHRNMPFVEHILKEGVTI
ncbi:predicted nucleotidyltransferase [Candidatus Vecturithrix granuli]|uniref:Predicted nucleotidyltransferase n=1 Tax=Vecturithrix granuli TaxID=1499967 RepID=A0A081C3Q8_VECG1|nr:predicted nucleotidyltransferase [Candidatus Vecturithrix granuli]